MDALSKILEQIELKSKAHVEKLRLKNEEQCFKIIENEKKMVEKEQIKLNKKIDLFKKSFEVRVDAENLIFRKNAFLDVKQNLVSEVAGCVVDALCTNEVYEQSYFNFMEKLIAKSLPNEKCVVFYGKLDYDRFLENFNFKNSENLKIEKSNNFDYGALVCCNSFQIDLNVKNLVYNLVYTLRLEILNVLEQGELLCE